MVTRYPTLSETRAHLPEVLDAAEAGIPLRVERRSVGFAVITESLLAGILTGDVGAPQPEVYSENDGWTIILPGTPVAADSTSFDDAIEDFIEALTEYAEDWASDEDLRRAPSHKDNVALVQLVSHLSEDQLRDWVVGANTSAVATQR